MQDTQTNDTVKTAEIDTNTMEKTSLYIGLETSTGLDIAPIEVIEFIADHVDAGTFEQTKGLWRGELENSLKFSCVDIESHMELTVAELQDLLADEFNQDSVLVEQELVGVAF